MRFIAASGDHWSLTEDPPKWALVQRDGSKDSYADRQYDRAQPYNQEIQDIIGDYSLVRMLRVMKSGSRALRNSDYSDPDIKRQLLQEVMRCWEQLCKVLMILLPPLTEKGYAVFEGQGFLLQGNFGETPLDRLVNILANIPFNVTLLSQDDIFSQKMGPLLISQLECESNEIKRHLLIRLLIHQRPRNWMAHIERYIDSVSKNSFYLLDVYSALRAQYMCSYVSPITLREIEKLIRMTAEKHAKHGPSYKNAGKKVLRRVTDAVIPPRNPERNL